MTTAVLVALVSCQAGSNSDICEESTSGLNAEGEKVVVCKKFHESAPYVRPQTQAGALIGGLDSDGLFTYVGASQTLETVTLVHDDGRPYACSLTTQMGMGGMGGMGMVDPDNPAPSEQVNECDPAHQRGTSERRIYTLYKVEGVVDSVKKTLTARSVAPYLVATPEAIDKLYDKPFAGTANFRKATYNEETDGIFSYEEATVPVLLMPVRKAEPQSFGSSALADSPLERTLPTVFKVANYDQRATGAEGTCYPALTSFGDRNPLLRMKTNAVQMARRASMHAPGTHTMTLEATDLEDHPQDGWNFAFGSGAMSAQSPNVMFKPATWLSSTIDLTTELTQTQNIHGRPNGLNLSIAPAKADSKLGQSCP